MAENDRRPPIIDQAQLIRNEVARQAQEIRNAPEGEQAARRATLDQQIREEFRRQAAAAEEAQITIRNSRGNLPDQLMNSANRARLAAVRLLEGVKLGLIPLPDAPKTAAVLTNLADEGMTERNAAYLYPVIQKALTDPNYINFSAPGQEKTQFEQDFERLKARDESAAGALSQAVVNAGEGRLGVADQILREKLATRQENRSDEEVSTQTEAEETFKRDWEHYYSNFPFDVAKDRPVLEGLYMPEKFLVLVNTVEREMRSNPEFSNLDDTQFMIALSERVSIRVTSALSKIYSRVDQSGPKKFFNELVQEDPFQGIQATSTRIKSHLSSLQNYFAQYKDKAGAYPMLYRSSEPEIDVTVTEVKTNIKDRDGNVLVTEKPKHRLNPQLIPKKVSLAEYIAYLSVQVENYASSRDYLHNGRAIYHRQPGKDGFYMQLGEFAEGMGSVDIDEMNHLPDARMMLQAYRLYDKFLEETFASNDWKHDSTLFTKRMEELSTGVENEVTDALQAIYSRKNEPDIDARITAARNMAVGYARAVLLTEAEKMAFADPHLSVGGGATGASYGVADPGGPMVPFNPLHWGGRWQNQNNLHQLLFMPVDGLKGKDRPHDHNMAMKMMEKYQNSWLEGRGAMELPKGAKLLIDYYMNPGKVGGPLKRGGWRKLFSMEGYYEYKDPAAQKLDYFKTWKALEKIGYEALSDFCIQKISPKFAAPGEALVSDEFLKTDSSERTEFFSYLYGKYFTDLTGPNRKPLAGYFADLVKSEKADLIKKIRSKEAFPKDIDEQASINAGRTFLKRTLSRVIMQRFPTKFARIDRDRFSEKGVSRWKQLMYNANLGVDNDDRGNATKDKQLIAFDRAMKDLGIAEAMLREEMSDQIRKEIKASGHKIRLSEVSGTEYRLTEDKVREFLGERNAQLSEKRIERAIAVFKAMYENNPTRAEVDPKTCVERKPIIITEFLDGFDSSEYPFTFAADEIDMSLVGLRGAGQRILPRALKDVGQVENNVVKVINDYWIILKDVAINRKHDFAPIIEGMKKIKDTMEGVHSPESAAEVNHHMAAVAINYFKKDTIAKPFFGLLGMGRKNSLAAEWAGHGAAVWEWDSRVIDKFVTELETHDIVPKRGINLGRTPKYEPVWINIPFVNKPVKVPFLEKRVKDYSHTSKELRNDFGGAIRHVAYDMFQIYIPLSIGIVLFFLINKAFKEAFEKQK